MNLKTLSILIFFFLLPCHNLTGQIIDLGALNFSGKYQTMGGAGIGIVKGISSIDLNPAGLAGTEKLSFLVSQNYKYYKYDLLRGGDGSIFNKNRSAMPFEWNKKVYDFRNLSIAYPVTPNLSLGIGFIQKLNPFIYNRQRALTWSGLFHHDLFGSVYALVVSSGYKIQENLYAGISFYNYAGIIHSTIKGDNHLKDRNKWANLDNDLSGMNFRAGMQYIRGKISTGLVFETPYTMTVKTEKDMSPEGLYQRFLPLYDQAEWEMPWIIGFGFAFTGNEKWTFTLDLESRHYKESDVRLNLFEYAIGPNWKDPLILRTGLELFPWKWRNLPLRMGYAYIPQLYATDVTMSTDKNLNDNSGSGQVVKHLVSAGTGFSFSQFTLDIGCEYYFLNWNRTFHTTITVEDDYRETDIILFMTLKFTI